MNRDDTNFTVALLEWYRTHGRDLPWRKSPSPYAVLVSEFMLQQTRVDTVIPYFNRFMERFPSLADLAKAEEGEVLRYWQGLGYYSRARNLKKTAHKCLESEQGCLPFDSKKLSEMPGIGPYMEKAIRAFAFGLPAVPIDGNLMRVYSRLEALAVYPDDPKEKKKAEAYFMDRLDSPREFGQALMDLGELICLPNGTPKCETCPLRFYCHSHTKGEETLYPLKKAKQVRPVEHRAVLFLLDGKGNIAVRKRPSKGLLASMDEFPNVLGAKEELQKAYPGLSLRHLGKATHVFSHIEWKMDVYAAVGELPDFTYMPLTEIKEKAALPTAFAKLLSLYSPV